MSAGQRLRAFTLLAALVASGALLVLAATLSGAELRRGIPLPGSLADLLRRSLPQPLSLSAPPIIWDIIRVAIWGTLLLTLIYLFVSREARRDMARIMLKIIVTLLVTILILLPFWSLASPPQDDTLSEAEAPPPASVQEITELEEQLATVAVEANPPPVLTTLLTIVLITGGALLAYRWWQERVPPDPPLPVEDLAEHVRQAMEALRQGRQIEDVIPRCYQQMVQVVATHRGLERGRAVTPREFEAQLQARGLPARPVQRLTRLFEEVRYGHVAAGERAKAEAIDSLETIVAACEALDAGRRR